MKDVARAHRPDDGESVLGPRVGKVSGRSDRLGRWPAWIPVLLVSGAVGGRLVEVLGMPRERSFLEMSIDGVLALAAVLTAGIASWNLRGRDGGAFARRAFLGASFVAAAIWLLRSFAILSLAIRAYWGRQEIPFYVLIASIPIALATVLLVNARRFVGATR